MATAPVQYLTNSYYKNLLTSEYRGTVEFQAWMDTVLNIAQDISNCLLFISSSFDIDQAIGVQLDTLGEIIGVGRIVPFQPSGGASPILDDDTYRLLLRATIFNNQWDGKIGSMYPIWRSLFPSGRISIIDNQNMTATIVASGSLTDIIKDLIRHDMIIPRPQSVAYNYIFSDLPLFGFGPANAFIAGFGVGKWG
jgi:hypothetical protein